MTLSICSFSSGSSGNCYMVKDNETAILVDVGISGKKILEGLDKTNTAHSDVQGIFITHEHTDHIKSLRVIGKKLPQTKAFANEKTWKSIDLSTEHLFTGERKCTFETGKMIALNSIKVKAFRLSHDAAEPVGYSFFKGDRQISIVTDTGCITEEIFSEISRADLVVLEANHEVRVLEMGRYPYYLKRRILGDKGHLSNELAAKCICRMVEEHPGKRKILLGHMSKENNTPDLAYMTIKNILAEQGIYPGGDLDFEVIHRDEASRLYSLSVRRK